jgi:hypothetical protein
MAALQVTCVNLAVSQRVDAVGELTIRVSGRIRDASGP